MLENIFSQVIHMSLTASVVILIVLAARMFLNKVPKVFSYILWAIVLFRLLSPVSISSAASIFTVMDMTIAEEYIMEEMPEETYEKQEIIPENSETLDSQPNSMKIYPAVDIVQKQSLSEKIRGCLPYIWLAGIVCVALGNLIQLRKLRKKMVGAVCLTGKLYLSDYITEPFVIGLVRPRIYLPSNIEEKEQAYIILHEQIHIRRLDHITRTMAFVALCIHWFNPLVWVAFRLSAKDMEMSCDEAVMNALKEDIRSEYAQSLLNFATGHRKATAMPLAFGESDTKSRIKNVMNWKKPAIWGSIVAVICMIVLGMMLMTDSKQQEDVEIVTEEDIEQAEDIEPTDPIQNVKESVELSGNAKRLFYSQWKVTGVAGTTTEYEESAFEEDSMIDQAVGSVVWGNPEQLCIHLEGNSEGAVVIVDENPKVKERLITSTQFEEEWGINPENILLYEDEFIEIEVLADGNFPGGKAYLAGDKNAIIYFESVFFSAELARVQQLTMDVLLEAVETNTMEDVSWHDYSHDVNTFADASTSTYYISCELEHAGKELVLNCSFEKESETLRWIIMTIKEDESSIRIYDRERGGVRLSKEDILDFVKTDHDIMNEVVFGLPEGMILDTYHANIGFEGGRLILPMEYDVYNEGTAPDSWRSSGMVSRFTQEYFLKWNEERIERFSSYDNHTLTEIVEQVDGLCAPALLMSVEHDLYTAGEQAKMIEDGIDIHSIETTSKYWYLIIAEPGKEYGYVITLNQKNFAKEDILELGKTVRLLK